MSVVPKEATILHSVNPIVLLVLTASTATIMQALRVKNVLPASTAIYRGDLLNPLVKIAWQACTTMKWENDCATNVTQGSTTMKKDNLLNLPVKGAAKADTVDRTVKRPIV